MRGHSVPAPKPAPTGRLGQNLYGDVPSGPSLYDPRFEHDACGVGFIAQLGEGPSPGLRPSRTVVDKALGALERMEHRGATGADEKVGDGAGILVQIPHE